MRHLSSKYTLLLVSISVFICMPSCFDLEAPDPPRPVTCEMPEGYDYEDYYERWRQPVCTTSLCSTYTSIWKDLLIERTTLTEPYFDEHFEIFESLISSSGEGDFFVIGYRMQNDWAIAYNGDKFIIRIHEGTNSFPEIGLPVDTYLSKKEIAAALDNKGFESRIDEIPKTGPLKFSSPEEALNTLITEADVDTLCFYRVVLSNHIGTLTLKSFARYLDNEDECIEAAIDLITGQTFIKRTHPCSNGYDR
ncbi:MAG: hypothetical protein U9R60_18865 [Bacteroidota bacterium]|nr:hypothetical protein [Bacteroidota bacterium]